ncbi:MAG: superoxide dismutase [Hyphomicrobiales bacterium]
MNKRTFLKTSAALGVFSAFAPKDILGNPDEKVDGKLILTDRNGKYTLPPLPYSYAALEPIIDEKTMKLHHDIHHAGYVKGLDKATIEVNKAIEENDYSKIAYWEALLAFHGGGHFLHSIFWHSMSPKKTDMSAELGNYITKDFGSLDNFKNYFAASTNAIQGSGWGVLTYQPEADRLIILQCEKHQNLSQWISTPILVLDVWEHAYYLKYQNRRLDYINSWFDIVNWKWVSDRLSYIKR